MATEKELAEIFGPIQERLPGWQYRRGWLFRQPIGYYLRGLALNRSWSDRRVARLQHCVYPLYESEQGIHTSWGESNPIPGTTNHGWNVFHPDFAPKLMELMDAVIIPATAHIEKGSDFLGYLGEHRIFSGWPDWGRALAYVHMGDLAKARAVLIPLAETIRSQFPHLGTPGKWGHDLLELLRLIEHDPDAIPARCEAIARKGLRVRKLEKFWVPTPFVYDNARGDA